MVVEDSHSDSALVTTPMCSDEYSQMRVLTDLPLRLYGLIDGFRVGVKSVGMVEN